MQRRVSAVYQVLEGAVSGELRMWEAVFLVSDALPGSSRQKRRQHLVGSVLTVCVLEGWVTLHRAPNGLATPAERVGLSLEDALVAIENRVCWHVPVDDGPVLILVLSDKGEDVLRLLSQ